MTKKPDAKPRAKGAGQTLALEWIPAGDLRKKKNPRNWRRHPEAQRAALRDLLEDPETGWAGALLYNSRTGRLIDGHGRLELDSIADTDPVPVLVGSWSDAAEQKILLTLDATANGVTVDADALAELLENADLTSKALAGIRGEHKRQLDRILDDNPTPGQTEPDDVPDPAEADARTKTGDLWLLGDHRILCGDATAPASYKRLLAGKPANLVHTDPPYGVSYVKDHAAQRHLRRSTKHLSVKADDKTGDRLLQELLVPAFKQLARHTTEAAAFYIWHSDTTVREFLFALDAAALVATRTIIWTKPRFILGKHDYHQAHEPCLYAAHDGHTPAFYGDRTKSSVWRVAVKAGGGTAATVGPGILVTDGEGRQLWLADHPPKGRKYRTLRLKQGDALEITPESAANSAWEVARDNAREYEHPTQKPVELALRAIRNSSRPGETVLDVFLGAGGTLIAAEQLDRRCCAMELEPKYVDVAVKRWEKFTGKKATKEPRPSAKKNPRPGPRRNEPTPTGSPAPPAASPAGSGAASGP